ncbi:MAG: phytanoyl-CoA dioxygenase, partial [Planctomycetia bacterium]|nr:phytanoyl-CoA dioxygenase [Planctomycetia bacterium]
MRPFLDSTEYLDDASELKRRLERDGYIFLRGLLPREDVQ